MSHKLLLADDSVTIQRVIELTFADEDIQVIAVGDGDQAIARIDADPPDIVLADIGMPGRNGYEVAAHIKQSPHLSHIPVLLLTGAFEPVDQARVAAVGCDGVLAKPFEPQAVISRVRELLARPYRAGEVPDATLAAPPTASSPTGELPGAPLVETPAEHSSQASDAPTEPLDDYFDRLDAAFATLTSTPAGQPGQHRPLPPASQPVEPPPAPASTDEIDWFPTAQPDTSTPPDLPLSYASPQAEFDRLPAPTLPPPQAEFDRLPAPTLPPPQAEFDRLPALPPPRVERMRPPVRAPAAPEAPPPRQLPALADAFAALLASEQAAGSPVAPAWPASPATGPAITNELVDEVVRRVLDRLPDRVVGETVADLVSTVAERLVREEIERIKASVK